MSLTLNVPDDVLAAIPVPEAERERFVLREIACLLYARDLLSLGRAAELAGLSKIEFGLELVTSSAQLVAPQPKPSCLRGH